MPALLPLLDPRAWLAPEIAAFGELTAADAARLCALFVVAGCAVDSAISLVRVGSLIAAATAVLLLSAESSEGEAQRRVACRKRIHSDKAWIDSDEHTTREGHCRARPMHREAPDQIDRDGGRAEQSRAEESSCAGESSV